MELRSLVDFLNRQMTRSDVLLVEARMFEKEGARFVVPSLFGYSEEARRVKRVVTVTTESTRKRRKWDKESFFSELAQQTDSATVAAVQKLFDFALSQPHPIRWGSGETFGTMSFLKLPAVHKVSGKFTADTNGRLSLWFALLDDKSQEHQFADVLYRLAVDKWGLKIRDDYYNKCPGFASAEWINSVDAIVEGCRQLATEFG